MTTPPEPEYFTADDVAKQVEEARREAIEQARKEERDKLYPKIEATDSRYKEMAAEVETLRKAENERQKAADKAARDAEKARIKAAEAELEAKALIEKRTQEWQAQLEARDAQHAADRKAMQEAQELQAAVYAKDREMADLQIYIRDRVAAEQNNIAPELMDFITGETKEQVDASIEIVKAKTAAILEGVRQAGITGRAGMPGTAPVSGATGLTPGIDTGDKNLSPDDIKGMSMQDFSKLRAQMGMNGNGSGRGIFG